MIFYAYINLFYMVCTGHNRLSVVPWLAQLAHCGLILGICLRQPYHVKQAHASGSQLGELR